MGGNQSSRKSKVLITEASAGSENHLRMKYRFSNKLIGKGAFAKVYKGSLISDPSFKVAIKCLNLKLMLDKDIKAAEDEIKILSSLDHPNIVKFYEAFKDDQYIYIVTEFIKGQTLSEYINKDWKPMKEAEAANAMQQLVSAVNYCHSHNIVHRDIKLENVLIDDNLRVTLIDFGLSTTISKGKFLKSKVGSPLFLAPEVSQMKYSNKCDIWSLGVLMYVLLSWRLPFSGDSPAEVLAQSKEWDLGLESKFWKPISCYAKDLLSKMIKINESDRYSWEEVLKHEWFESWKDASTDDSLETSEENLYQSFEKIKCDASIKDSVTLLLLKIKNAKNLGSLCKRLKKIDMSIKDEALFQNLQEALRKSNVKLSEKELKDIFESLNADPSSGSKLLNTLLSVKKSLKAKDHQK